MQIRFRTEMECQFPGPTPMIQAHGRMLIGRVSDACDLALAGAFGSNTAGRFKIWTVEVTGP